MPDVLGMTQDALCPEATCELAHSETGLAEPCEHQLDLLVVSVPTQKSRNCQMKFSSLFLLFIFSLNSQRLVSAFCRVFAQSKYVNIIR